MVEVHIRHCTLRLVRHGGWSWGPEPRGLLEQVREKLPRLLERTLAQWQDASTDLEVSQPLRLRLPLRYPIDEAGLHAALTRALARTGALPSPVPNATRTLARSTAPSLVETPGPNPASQPRPMATPGLVRVLAEWSETGMLAGVLASTPTSLFESWRRVLERELFEQSSTRSAAPTSTSPDDELAQRLRASPGGGAALADPRPNRPALAILLLVLAMRQPRIALSRAELDGLLDRFTGTATPTRDSDPLGGTARPALEAPTVGERRASESAPPQSDRKVMKAPRHPPPDTMEWSREVDSSLPFLVLGELARIGWLSGLAGCLEGAGLERESAAVATLLAYKCLQPPLRGWRRSPTSIRDAATFAGLREPLPEAQLMPGVEPLGEALLPLDAWLRVQHARASTTPSALLVHKVGSAEDTPRLLFDFETLQPLGWYADPASLLDGLAWFSETPLLISAAAADRRLLAALDAAGHRFVTRARPLRDENWQATGSGAAWSNTASELPPGVTRWLRELADREADAEAIHGGLVLERPLCVTRPCERLERILTTATGTALARIAAKLWGEREPTTPILALERFGDLGARVTIDPAQVRVHLPLGRRSMDLNEHGLLEPITRIPWLQGRRLDFTGV